VSSSEQSQIRTRMFARAFGPFFVIVPATIAVRATTLMKTLLSEFAADPMWQWVLGAILVLWGSIIIAFHQYWRSAAAIIVSLLGWFLAVRGVLILVVPQTYVSVGNSMEQGAVPFVRAIFIGLALAGLYLTYVGWIAAPSRPESAAVSPTQDRGHAAGD
jgi:hypothetical protein